MDQSPLSSDDEENSPQLDVEELKTWALTNNISHLSLNQLLAILKPICPELPSDARTLLNTNRDSKCVSTGSGEFVYFGLTSFINKISKDPVDVSINVDGIPLYKSTQKQFWPILATFNDSNPIVVAIYSGSTKPDIQFFLLDFINELKVLNKRVNIKNFVCDSPARAFLKCIKSHSGYSSCDKCTIKGKYDGHVYFDETNCTQRTDDTFRSQSDGEHHKGTSPLTELSVDMITTFPYDYMHLVCLGVMKRLIFFWLIGPLVTRFPRNILSMISVKLIYFMSFLPTDFSRRPRSLDVYRYWKATEYRTFLLFTGIVSLKDVVPNDVYCNFTLLHAAIYLLCDPDNCESNLAVAQKCLDQFVATVSTIYGKNMVVYNVHALLHLCQDASIHGNLDKFSAFQFENKLGQIKNKLRAKTLPLQQIVNRLSEQGECLTYQNKSTINFKNVWQGGVILNLPIYSVQYKSLFFKDAKFSVNEKDCYFMDYNCMYFKIVNIVKSDDKVFFISKQFRDISPFYSYPFSSLKLNIAKVNILSEAISVDINNVYRKCCGLPYGDSIIMIPMFIKFL